MLLGLRTLKREINMNFLKTVGGAVASAFTSSGIETPAFETSTPAPHAEVEKRLYPATSWVSYKVKGMQHKESVRQGFFKLFNYIQGNNETGTTIPMTAPVTVKVEPGAGPNCESTFTISFYIGKDFVENTPKPKEEGVFLQKLDPMTVYARTFDGFATDEKWISNAASLAENLGEDAKFEKDYYFTAGYDSPFKLFKRRNEVWFIVPEDNQKKTAEDNQKKPDE